MNVHFHLLYFIISLVGTLGTSCNQTNNAQPKNPLVIDYIASNQVYDADIQYIFDNNTQTYITTNGDAPFVVDFFFDSAISITKIGYTPIGNESNFIRINNNALINNYLDSNLQDLHSHQWLKLSTENTLKRKIQFYTIDNSVHTIYTPDNQQFALGDITFYTDSMVARNVVLPRKINAKVADNKEIAFISDAFFVGKNTQAIHKPQSETVAFTLQLADSIDFTALKIYTKQAGMQASEWIKWLKIKPEGGKKTKVSVPSTQKTVKVVSKEKTRAKNFEIEITLTHKALQMGYLPIEMVFFDHSLPVNLVAETIQKRNSIPKPLYYSIQDSTYSTTFYSFVPNADGSASLEIQNDSQQLTSVSASWEQTSENEILINAVMFNGTDFQLFSEKIKTENEVHLFQGKKMYTSPPRTSLVNIKELIDSAIVEIPYATPNNFIKQKVYPCSQCLLRYETAKAIKTANDTFATYGYRIKFLDCYRPISVQRKMWEIMPNPAYVANPSGNGSMHNRGVAIDLTLIDASGNELNMGTEFDYFGKEAAPTYPNLPADVLQNRQFLIQKLNSCGFQGINSEWWHYFYSPNMDLPLVKIEFRCNE